MLINGWITCTTCVVSFSNNPSHFTGSSSSLLHSLWNYFLCNNHPGESWLTSSIFILSTGFLVALYYTRCLYLFCATCAFLQFVPRTWFALLVVPLLSASTAAVAAVTTAFNVPLIYCLMHSAMEWQLTLIPFVVLPMMVHYATKCYFIA